MNRVLRLLLLAAAFGAAAPCRADTARGLMKRGLDAYEAGDWTNAAAFFASARARAAESDLPDAVAALNEGLAAARADDAEAAAARFDDALRHTDPAFLSKAYYNRGTLGIQRAERAAAGGALEPAVDGMAQAVQDLRHALTLDPAVEPAKRNLEMAQNRLRELKQALQEQQQQQQEQEQQQGQRDDQPSPDPQGDREPRDDESNDRPPPPEGEQEPDPAEPEKPATPEEPGEREDSSTPPPAGEESGEAEAGRRPRPAEEMTEEEAAMLLNAMKEEELRERSKWRLRLGRPQPVEKDW
jgi:hypothetical protein